MGLTISINDQAAFNVVIGVPGPTGPAGPVGPAGPAFTGGPITSAITYGVGTYTTVFENGDIYTEDTSSGAYGVVYINGLEASDGTNTITMSSSGIQFPDSTVQTTAFPGSAAFYPATGNPSGFLTASALTPYLLSSTAASTYQTISGMSAYLQKAGGYITGDIQSNNNSAYRSYDGSTKTSVLNSNYLQLNTAGGGGGVLTIESSGITFPSGKQTVHYPGLSILSGYATESWVTAGFYPLTGNPSAFLTDAPSDGSQYARQDGAWSVVTGGGGDYLPLAGGTMTGAIVFDGTSGQYISKGNFDTSRGGNYGISLVCSIGYEFNWQAGWLTTTNQGSVTPRPLYLDSLAGTTLRAWDSATDTGVEVAHTGINVSNTSPYYVNVAPDTLKVFESTNELGVTIAHDSIAIQHIDTPNVTGYVTNEYIGFEDLGGSPHSAFVEHDVITVQNETSNTAVRADGVIITQSDSTASLGISTVNFNTPIANGYLGATELGIYDYVNSQTLTAGAAYVRLQTPGLDPGLAQPKADLTASALNFLFEDEVPAATYAATGITFPDSTVQTTAYTGGGGGGLPTVQIAASAINPSYISTGANFTAIAYPTHTDILNGTYATAINYSNDAVGNPALILSGLTSLTYAQVNGNASMTSAPDFSGCTALYTANVYSNASMTSAPSFSGLTALNTANVYSNASMTSAPSFSGCTSLNTANVSDNALMTSAPSFSGLTSLTTAYVSDNALMTSAPSFSGCTSLYSTNVYNNALMTSAPSFSGCTSLYTANVGSNASMTSAPDFTTITQSGIQIYLNGCAISDCTTPLDQLDAGGGSSGFIDLSGGSNQSIDPTYYSLLSLQAKGWTVAFNSL